MTQEEIRLVVKMTLEELSKQDSYPHVLSVVEGRLKRFFNGSSDKLLAGILRGLDSDSYTEVVYMIYRDGMTLEQIAEALGKDVSTVKRNKKRLMYKIYDSLL